VAAPNEEIVNNCFALIQEKLQQTLKILHTLTMFNGLDIDQSQKFVKISCCTYLRKVLEGHGWSRPTHGSPLTTPMNHDKRYMSELETSIGPIEPMAKATLQREMMFSYRQAIGELLFAAITCRPDIMYSIIKLSQYSTKPAKIHYIAVKRVFKYLRDTIDDGLHLWRPKIQPTLPSLPCPAILPDNYDVTIPTTGEKQAHVLANSDWAGDISHRRLISGMGNFFAGGSVVYRSRFQTIVSTSLIEAEFIAADDASKLTLYLRSILNDLGIMQDSATKVHGDNDAAITMANSQRPTRQTRHMDIRHFALLDWIETDQIILSHTSTRDNPAARLTKALRPQLLSRHCVTLLGKKETSVLRFLICICISFCLYISHVLQTVVYILK